MAQSIGMASSLAGHRLMTGGIPLKDRRSSLSPVVHLIQPPQFFGRRFVVMPPVTRLRLRKVVSAFITIKALAGELTEEAYSYSYSFKEERIRRNLNIGVETDVYRAPPDNRADKPSLHNPLLRQERMGCGWIGAIFEWEGVISEENPELEKQAWMTLSQQEGKSPPPAFILKRIEGMKNEQAISEVLCWSRNPKETKRLASRKEEILNSLQGGIYRLRDGSEEFVNLLMNYKIPMALVSTRSRKSLETAMRATGVDGYFDAVVAADDVYRGKPDPEMYNYAAQLLQFIPERCIVFGNSNQTVEAAHDARMKCVAVASKHRIYELGAADLVVRQLDELSVVDLKNLAAVEENEFGSAELEMEMEIEEDDRAAIDSFW